MPILIVTIITVSGILTILCSTIYKNKLNPQGLMSSAFNVKIGWLVLRVLAVFFSWLTFLNIGPEMIKSEDTGGLVFSSLLPTLVAVFLFAAIFLPLLMEYGLLELLGPIFRPIMRPLFTLPGRSTVDNLASFIGDGTVGVLITSRQYGEGYYSRREATYPQPLVLYLLRSLLSLPKQLECKINFLFLFNSCHFMLNCSNDYAKNLAT